MRLRVTLLQLQTVNNDSFGPLIAYLAPGATVLYGLSLHIEPITKLFDSGQADVPTIGGFLYLTVSSIAVGMTVSAVRWVTLDRLHEFTGIHAPSFDFSRLGESVTAFSLLIEIHYRHYLFYANMFVATLFTYVCYRLSVWPTVQLGGIDVAVGALLWVFLVTSRDTLQKYYRRGEQLLIGCESGLHREVTPSSAEVSSPASPQTLAERSQVSGKLSATE